MNTFFSSVFQSVKRAAGTFRTFPASLGCALAYTVVMLIRIALDTEQQAPYEFLLGCLNWSLAFGALCSLALTTAARSRFDRAGSFLAANMLGVAAAAAALAGLYFSGPAAHGGVGALAAMRIGAAMLLSLIAFIILAGYPKERADFTSAFFMTHKAFFVALIYGLVLWAGASGVAQAVERLLYGNMSEKVYMDIAALAGFLAYAVFVGYFPDFRTGDGRRYEAVRDNDIARDYQTASKQPRFIEILLAYILIPLVLALTAVLLAWAGKTALGGMKVPFGQLSAIAASYTVGGIWLHAMTAGNRSGIVKVYRLVYPAASLIILIFEAWAVVRQLQNTGLKLTEYAFIMIWIVAAAGAVLLLLQGTRAHIKIAVIICALAVLCVLPGVGYYALPATAQANRLERLLTGAHMLSDGRIIPAPELPDQKTRSDITDAVFYLSGAEDAKLPGWFDPGLSGSVKFREVMGFEQTWSHSDGNPGAAYSSVYLYLPEEPLDISGYRWAVNAQNRSEITVKGAKGVYGIKLSSDYGTEIPAVTVTLDGRVIAERSLSGFIDSLTAKYPMQQGKSAAAEASDMCFLVQSPQADVLLVFGNIELGMDTADSTRRYGFGLSALYLKENG